MTENKVNKTYILKGIEIGKYNILLSILQVILGHAEK